MEQRDVMTLSFWEKNAAVREITQENWDKLVADIQRNGVLQPFKVDATGIVYDGNNRLKALRTLLAKGITQTENGQDLTHVPVIIYPIEKESDKWEIALKSNEQFANWNSHELANYMPEFEDDLDISLINVDFWKPESLDEQLDVPETLPQAPAEPPSDTTAPTDTQQGSYTREVICPNCNTKFTL